VAEDLAGYDTWQRHPSSKNDNFHQWRKTLLGMIHGKGILLLKMTISISGGRPCWV